MRIARLAGVEISSIPEKVPFDSSNHKALSRFCIEVPHFHAWVSDEYRSQAIFDILEVSAGAELREGRGESAGFSPGDIVARSHSAIKIDIGFENRDLFREIAKQEKMRDKWPRDHVRVHLLQRIAIDCWLAPFAYSWHVEDFVEEPLLIRVGFEVKSVEAEALANYSLEVPLEDVELGVVLLDDLGLALGIDTYSSEAHLKHRTLKRFR